MTFHNLLRSQRVCDKHTLLQNGPLCSDDRRVIKVDDIANLISLDFDCAILLFGTKWFLTTMGCCQGSILSPALCLLVTSWLHFTRASLPVIPMPPFWHFRFWYRQWVDDIYGVLAFCVPKKDVQDVIVEQSVVDLCDACTDVFKHEWLALLRSKFGLKVEDPNTFIGMRASVLSGRLEFYPDAFVKVVFSQGIGTTLCINTNADVVIGMVASKPVLNKERLSVKSTVAAIVAPFYLFWSNL